MQGMQAADLAVSVWPEVCAGGKQRGLEELGCLLVQRVHVGGQERSAAQRAQRAHRGPALHAQPECVRIVPFLQRLPVQSPSHLNLLSTQPDCIRIVLLLQCLTLQSVAQLHLNKRPARMHAHSPLPAAPPCAVTQSFTSFETQTAE